MTHRTHLTIETMALAASPEVDAIEIQGMRDTGGIAEPTDKRPGYYTVFAHRNGRGADTLADCKRLAQARELARLCASLGRREPLPVHEFTASAR